jgi:hypothetical protein
MDLSTALAQAKSLSIGDRPLNRSSHLGQHRLLLHQVCDASIEFEAVQMQ